MPLDASVVFCPPLSSDPAADAGGGDLPLPCRLWKLILGLSFMPLVRVDGSGFADLSQVGLDGGQLHGHEPGGWWFSLHWCDGADSFCLSF